MVAAAAKLRRRHADQAGSASGLRNNPCMMAPAAASMPPTMAAKTMRGSRIDHSTSSSRAVSALTGAPPQAERRRQPGDRNARRANGRGNHSRAGQRGEQANQGEGSGRAIARGRARARRLPPAPSLPAIGRQRGIREAPAAVRAPGRGGRPGRARPRGTRAEAEQIKTVHGNEGVVGRAGVDREGRWANKAAASSGSLPAPSPARRPALPRRSPRR